MCSTRTDLVPLPIMCRGIVGQPTMRNKSEDVKKLLLQGIQAVVALTTPANGRPTNEHLPGSDENLTPESACLHLKEGRSVHRSGTALLDTRPGDCIYPPAVPASSPGLAPA
jgi:hypothetical protein